MTSNPQNEHYAQKITDLEARINQLQNDLKTKDGQIICLNDTILTLKNQLQKQSEKTAELQKLLESKQKELFEAGGQNLAKDNLLEQRQAEIQKYKNQIMKLKHQLLYNKDRHSIVKGSQSPSQPTQKEKERSMKFSETQAQELERLEKENKRLTDENLKLSSQLQQLSNDEFLTKPSRSSAEKQQIHFFGKQTHQVNQKQSELSKPQEPIQFKQEQQGQEAPKKRKLMRKPRIEVDIDTFAVSPVNI